MAAHPEKEKPMVAVDLKPEDFGSFVQCATYNVVLIGDSRVGKSTFIDLQQVHTVTSDDSPYRGTVLPEVKTLFYHCKVPDRKIVLNMLDTPGLDEQPIDGVARPNEKLKDLISGHIKERFTDLSLILITIKKGGLTDGVIKSVYDVMEYFGPKYLPNMCLLITHCDNMTAEREQAYLNKLKEGKQLSKFITAVQGRVLFTGRNDSYGSTTNELEFIQEQTRRRSAFLSCILSSQKINLKHATDLSDIRPIDILESASTTNQIILTLGAQTKAELDSMRSLLQRLSQLHLVGEKAALRDRVVEQIGTFIREKVLTDSSDDEKAQAQAYTMAEIPLKAKAEQMKQESFQIKTNLATVESTLRMLSLDQQVRVIDHTGTELPILKLDELGF